MKINNEEEYQEAQKAVAAAERIAGDIWRYKHPAGPLPRSLRNGDADARAAWSLACDIAHEHTGTDPDAAAEALADYRNNQADPSEDYKSRIAA